MTVTWPVVVYALLAIVLAGGFAWYERSRPPARVVALVAALAALAIAGRLAFAAIPNVVATTDIVLITGYAVGAAPGFAVGALTAAVSNIWLGQGPWTPWQMAGWGLIGLAGAALATATGRRLGRVGLAVACAFAGLAYGALLDLSVMVTYGGEQSLDRYLAVSARGVPFNVAHALGNVAIALAAGPALVRMISRYRRRFEFRWREAGAVPLTALLVAALLFYAPDSRAGQTFASAAGGGPARAWLERAQNPDGGFGAAPGAQSNVAMTGWAALGLEAAGRNPFDVRKGGASALAYLRANAATPRSSGDLERTILVLGGAGANPHRFGGRDLVAELRARRSPGGSFEGQVNLTAFGILALRAAGAPHEVASRSARWLRGAQNRDGGWGFRAKAPSDSDSTGAALQGLAAGAKRGRAVRRGVAYLRRAQGRDGGFALAGSSASNSQSTAWAVQGLIAAGRNPASVRQHGHSPLDYLAARQAGDGHYRYSSSSDQTPVWVTGQALLAVNRKAFPISTVLRSAVPISGRAHPKPRSESAAGVHGAEAASAATHARRPSAGAHTKRGGTRNDAAPARRAHPVGPPARDEERSPKDGAPQRISRTPIDATAAAPPSGGGGGPGTGAYVGAGCGAAAALVAGFLWYRRRLS